MLSAARWRKRAQQAKELLMEAAQDLQRETAGWSHPPSLLNSLGAASASERILVATQQWAEIWTKVPCWSEHSEQAADAKELAKKAALAFPPPRRARAPPGRDLSRQGSGASSVNLTAAPWRSR